MRIQLPFQSYKLRSIPASTARLVNCFIEQLPRGAKTETVLYRSHGIQSAGTVGTGQITGMHTALGSLFVVSGSNLYKVDSSNVATLVGSVGSSTQTSIDMEHNNDSLVVVNTPNAYYYDGNTFGQITDDDYTSRGATDVEYCDGWLLFLEPNSGRFFGADLGSATDFDSLNFAAAEGAPDDLVGMKVDHRQVILFGSNSGEIWENTGAVGFPFERSINGFFEIGCLNGRTIEKLDNSVFWLANDYTVRRLEGATPKRISTHAIEQSLRDVTLSSGKSYSYTLGGHFFYVLTFDEDTFVYDVTTQEWHERKSYGYDYWIWRNHAQAFDREYVGSAINSSFGILSGDVYDEAGTTQVMTWTYQPVYAEGVRAFHDRLEVILEVAVGQATGVPTVVDPKIMLEYSDDAGRTWTHFPTRSIGKMGEYKHRVVWHQLGAAQQRVYRMSVSDAVKVAVTDTLLEVRGGRL